VQVLKKYDNWGLRKENWLILSKKKSENEIHPFGRCWEWQTTSLIAFILVCWLMLARRLRVYSAGLKVDTSREILTVIMTLYYKNIGSCKRHTVVHRAFCFWRFTLLFLGLATHTVSLDLAHTILMYHRDNYGVYTSNGRNTEKSSIFPDYTTLFTIKVLCVGEIKGKSVLFSP